MKTFTSLLALIGILAVAGCSSPRGGTADDYDYNSGSYNSGSDANINPMNDTLQQDNRPAVTTPSERAVPPVPPP